MNFHTILDIADSNGVTSNILLFSLEFFYSLNVNLVIIIIIVKLCVRLHIWKGNRDYQCLAQNCLYVYPDGPLACPSHTNLFVPAKVLVIMNQAWILLIISETGYWGLRRKLMIGLLCLYQPCCFYMQLSLPEIGRAPDFFRPSALFFVFLAALGLSTWDL